jgi:SM-20-related protein
LRENGLCQPGLGGLPLNDVPFALTPRSDLDQLKARLKTTGRVHVTQVFAADTANALYDDLLAHTGWRLAVNNDTVVYELKQAQIAALKPADFEEFARGIEQSARSRFQYVYDMFRVSLDHEGKTASPLLKQLFMFMNGPVFLQLMRDLTGDPGIRQLNMKASRYRAGHFLTGHNDGHVESRLYAYVLNFTPSWRTEWGGLLVFHDEDGHIIEGFSPAFNAINVFKVPMVHSVTMVTPSATKARYSLTGWMLSDLAGPPPT